MSTQNFLTFNIGEKSQKIPFKLCERYPDSWFGMCVRRSDEQKEFIVDATPEIFEEVFNAMVRDSREECVVRTPELIEAMDYFQIEFGRKIYDTNGNLVYFGDVVDGRCHGYGKEYKDGNVLYEGDFVNGRRHGTGKLFRKDGSCKFAGEFKNDQKNGHGITFNADGTKYHEGKYEKGQICGHGIFYINGMRHIEGKIEQHRVYEGVKYRNGRVVHSGSTIELMSQSDYEKFKKEHDI